MKNLKYASFNNSTFTFSSQIPRRGYTFRSGNAHGAAAALLSWSEITVSKAPTRAFTLLFPVSTSLLAVSSITYSRCWTIPARSSSCPWHPDASGPRLKLVKHLNLLKMQYHSSWWFCLWWTLLLLLSSAGFAGPNRSRLGVSFSELPWRFSTLPRRNVSLWGDCVAVLDDMDADFSPLALSVLGVAAFSVKWEWRPVILVWRIRSICLLENKYWHDNSSIVYHVGC